MAFVKLDRKIFNNPLWNENREYSRFEAWLDLISSALIENLKVHVKGQDIEVQRGEIAASRRFLENRWNWGSTKVTNYLSYLKKNGMITTRQTNGQTIIKLVKFEDYNKSETNKQTTGKPQGNQNKELKERKEVFYKQVIEYGAQYDSDELYKFFNHWSEHNENGKKMKFEFSKNQPFNIKNRLKTWFSNKKKWEKEKNIPQKKEKITAAQALDRFVNETSSNQ